MRSAAGVSEFFRLIHLPIVDSTSEEAKRLSRVGAEEGTLIWAGEQTAGRGRYRRNWISPAGNLYFSLLLRPHRPAYEVTQLTFAASAALAEAIDGLLPAGRRSSCKWPNDVLIGGRKIAGILLESQMDGGSSVHSLIVGVGVNIVSHPPPDAVMYAATSLHAEGALAVTPEAVLERFCQTFLRWYDTWRQHGFAPVRSAWLERAEKLHQAIEVHLGDEKVSGIFEGLDPWGALVLQQGKQRRLILAGDIFPVQTAT